MQLQPGRYRRYKRVVFNEITKKAIQEAFSKPGELDLTEKSPCPAPPGANQSSRPMPSSEQQGLSSV